MGENPTITRLLDTARARLPGVTDGLLKLELMNVIEDFCQQTSVWQDCSCLCLVPNKCEYSIFSSDGNGEIYRIIDVESACSTAPRFTAQAWMPVPGVLKVGFIPSSSWDLSVITALVPSELGKTQNYPGVPDWFWQANIRGITDGLIGRMMLQPAKPHTNPQLAQVHMAAYNRRLQWARMESVNGRVLGGQHWAYPQGFAVRRRKY
jgi:hypothetical protein